MFLYNRYRIISVFKLFGIRVQFHISWIVALLTVLLMLYSQISNSGISGFWLYVHVLWVAALIFFSVVVHEFGHGLVAKYFGVRVNSVTIFIFGGRVQMDREMRKPNHEVLVYLAGPLASLLMALAFGFLSYIFRGEETKILSEVFYWLQLFNLVLAIFNMLPAFPLDGGHVVRAIIWSISKNFLLATRCAVIFGKALAGGCLLLAYILWRAGLDLLPIWLM